MKGNLGDWLAGVVLGLVLGMTGCGIATDLAVDDLCEKSGYQGGRFSSYKGVVCYSKAEHPQPIEPAKENGQ